MNKGFERLDNIYKHHADRYQQMVAREDYEGHLLPAIKRLVDLEGITVVEFGAGTGRLTRLLAPHVQLIRAFDLNRPMLDEAEKVLAADGLDNYTLTPADSRDIPLGDDLADLAIAGWTLSMLTSEYEDGWREPMEQAVREMKRVTKPEGSVIIIETLGTGKTDPEPPSERLADYYRWLETEQGFTRNWIRTDYEFDSVEQAEDLIRFFFADLADWVKEQGSPIVPECTGLWHRRV
ncbi:MAG: methyltransferase domain-containing protein [Chloroflexi bacterium]|nr:methyltransferase domain-containing protein [Chloroflexota bacterium]